MYIRTLERITYIQPKNLDMQSIQHLTDLNRPSKILVVKQKRSNMIIKAHLMEQSNCTLLIYWLEIK